MSESKEYEIDLKEIVDILLKRKRIIGIGVGIFFVIGLFVAMTSPKIYQASTTLMVGSSNTFTSQYDDINMNDLSVSKALVSTYQEIAVSRTVLDDVVSTLGLAISPKALSGQIKVTSVNDTEIISIAATDRVPEIAKEIADTTASVFQDKVQNIMNIDNVKIIDAAALPMAPIKPNKKIILLASIFLGGVLSVGLIFVLEFFDDRIKNIEFFEKELGIPVIGTIFDTDEMTEGEQ